MKKYPITILAMQTAKAILLVSIDKYPSSQVL
jgi:hypothetical protein